jgi:large subunit ribosomal protein L10
MDRAQKKQFVENIHSNLQGAGVMVVCHYQGMTVAEISDLRRQARAAGASFQVTKNTLTKLGLKDSMFEPVSDLFTGPTAVAYSQDPVAAAKVLVDFAKNNDKVKILGGALGERRLQANDVEALAKMPSLDQLRGKILGLLVSPATKLVQLLQTPGGQVARVISAHAKQA